MTVSTIQKSQSIVSSDILLKGSALENSKGVISPRVMTNAASSHFFKRLTSDKKAMGEYLVSQANYRLD